MRHLIAKAIDWFDDRILRHRFYSLCQWLGKLEPKYFPPGCECKTCATWRRMAAEVVGASPE